MDDVRWFLAAVNSAAFLLCVGFLVYVVAILRPFLRRRDGLPGSSDEYDLHWIVPCLDEEDVIEATVTHLVRTFPRSTVWCVDDGSTDATGLILEALAEELPAVRVISRRPPEARQGKGAALNAAWRAISAAVPDGADRDRVLVGVLDADARLDRSCPDVVCGPDYFGDPQVAAVQVQVRVTEDVDALAAADLVVLSGLDDDRPRRDPLVVQLQDMEFTATIAAMQTLRRRTGSVGMGGNGQFTRLSALDLVAVENGTPWHGALLEDFELGLHVLLTGQRTEYCDDTFVAQAGLTRLGPLLRQRSRWAQGGLQCSKYLWRVMSSPQVPLSAALEIAYYLYVPWSQLLGSIVFPVAVVLDCYYVLATAGGVQEWWMAGAWGIAPLGLVFGVLPYLVWGPLYRARTGGRVSYGRALVIGLGHIGYGYLLQAAVWMAMYRIVRGRTDWIKTSHRRQTALPGARLPGQAAASSYFTPQYEPEPEPVPAAVPAPAPAPAALGVAPATPVPATPVPTVLPAPAAPRSSRPTFATEEVRLP